MNRLLQFRVDCEVNLAITGTTTVEQVKLRAGDVLEARVRPFVLLSNRGPIECADLVLGEEGVLCGVRMALFQFV
jgi:hypothetical protein